MIAGRSDHASPEAIATWLATDPRVWLAMLSDDDSQRRQLGKDRLARLLQQPIEFEPTAEAPVRQNQIELLRRHVLEGLGQNKQPEADRR